MKRQCEILFGKRLMIVRCAHSFRKVVRVASRAAVCCSWSLKRLVSLVFRLDS